MGRCLTEFFNAVLDAGLDREHAARPSARWTPVQITTVLGKLEVEDGGTRQHERSCGGTAPGECSHCVA
jgi:hypothetical protein